MHDLIIKGGKVVDGSGAPAQITDIACDDGMVCAVGRNLGPARRIVNADGALVTPGFVDVHTHYDGQATWDPFLTPSSFHGVTTAIFGNCGVGFAPVKPQQSPFLINLMEGVEDIPGSVLAEGVNFNWESFPQFLDVLDAAPKVMDIGAQVPHAPLRFYVMGERGADHTSIPSDDEIDRMSALLEEALKAGALGFTTSRTTKHLTRDGRNTPSLSAGEAELKGMALAMKRAGRGVLEVNSDFGPGEFEILRMAAELSTRPLSILLLQVNNAPDLWRETRRQLHEARAAGLSVNAQIGCRPIVIMMGLETTINPFSTHPAWTAMADLTPRQRFERLQHDSDLRHQLVKQRPDDEHTRRVQGWLPRTYIVDERFDYEPPDERSISSIATATGRDVWEVALDAMMSNNGKRLLAHTFENYTAGNLEVIREMLLDDATIMGLGDGGAHVCTVCDEGAPTYLLSHWARDRKRGERLPLEFLVKKHTLDSAMGYGLRDRGLLAPGYRADINVIDFEQLGLREAEVVYDLPAGGKRLIQRANGYLHTFVAGTEIVCNDEHTGTLPGHLLR
ncbi:MAG: amidohydrolase family protein [Burkholderiales bacterium]|jgi:N-acyl-D-aspartate/D-glutamate deacylase